MLKRSMKKVIVQLLKELENSKQDKKPYDHYTYLASKVQDIPVVTDPAKKNYTPGIIGTRVVEVPDSEHAVVTTSDNERLWASDTHLTLSNVEQTIKGNMVKRMYAKSIKKDSTGRWKLLFNLAKHDDNSKSMLLFQKVYKSAENTKERIVIGYESWADNSNLKIGDTYDLVIIPICKARRVTNTFLTGTKMYNVLYKKSNNEWIIMDKDGNESLVVSDAISNEDVGNNLYLEIQNKVYIYDKVIADTETLVPDEKRASMSDTIQGTIAIIQKDKLSVNVNSLEQLGNVDVIVTNKVSDISIGTPIQFSYALSGINYRKNIFIINPTGRFTYVDNSSGNSIFFDKEIEKKVNVQDIMLDPDMLGKSFDMDVVPLVTAIDIKLDTTEKDHNVSFNNAIDAHYVSKHVNNIAVFIVNTKDFKERQSYFTIPYIILLKNGEGTEERMRIAAQLNDVQLSDYNLGAKVTLLFQPQLVLTDMVGGASNVS
jgi:hypothetical protein